MTELFDIFQPYATGDGLENNIPYPLHRTRWKSCYYLVGVCIRPVYRKGQVIRKWIILMRHTLYLPAEKLQPVEFTTLHTSTTSHQQSSKNTLR